MKFKFDRKYIYWGITAFLVIAASIFFYYILFHRSSLSSGLRTLIGIAMPIIDGFVLAYLMTPVLNKIETRVIVPLYKKAKLPENAKSKKRIRGVSMMITVILIVIVFYEFFGLIIPEVVRSIQSIIFQLPIYLNNLNHWALGLMKNNPDLEQTVNELLAQYSPKLLDYFNTNLLPNINGLVKTLSLSVLGIFKALWNFVIGFIISIYVMGSKERFAGQAKKIAYALFDRKTGNEVISNFRFIHDTFIGFIGGKIVDSIIIGIICFAGTSIMKMPYALLISVIVGVTNVIPFFGPYLGAIPCTVLILMVNPVKCIYFILFILVLQQVDGNLIGPKILGESTGLSGFWVIFSITIFGGILGVPGMIIGVPFFAVLYAMIRRITNRMLKKKGLPTETEKYLDVDYITGKNVFIPRLDEHKKKSFFKLGKKSKKPSTSYTDNHETNDYTSQRPEDLTAKDILPKEEGMIQQETKQENEKGEQEQS